MPPSLPVGIVEIAAGTPIPTLASRAATLLPDHDRGMAAVVRYRPPRPFRGATPGRDAAAAHG